LVLIRANIPEDGILQIKDYFTYLTLLITNANLAAGQSHFVLKDHTREFRNANKNLDEKP
jgi:hypothetical protein